MNSRVKIFLWFLALVLVSSSITMAAKTTSESLYQEAKSSYESLKNSEKKRAKRHYWMRTARKFERVVKKYPKSSRAADAAYTLGRLYQELYYESYLKEDLKKSIGQFERVAKRYQKNSLADDALYHAANIYWKHFSDAHHARKTAKQIIRDYPDGDQKRRARALLASLPEKRTDQLNLSKHQTKKKRKKSKKLVSFDPDQVELSVENADHFHLSFPLPGHVIVEEQALEGRIYFDLNGVKLINDHKPLAPITTEHEAISRIRLGQFSPATVRLVLDLDQYNNHRIKRHETQFNLHVFSSVAAENRFMAVLETEPEEKAKKDDQKITLIAIDPGHGGDDPGAIGPRGTKEKDIALQISKKLKKEIEKTLGIEAFLTRETDIFIPLEERTKMANERGADLFLSIHCNAHTNRRLKGVQTYFLDTIKDQYSRKLAARENAVSLEKISNLEMILLDLTNRENHEKSSRLAGLIHNQMLHGLRTKYRSVNDLGVRTAVFLVLFYAEMPSVLIETSFLSNKMEENRLKKPAYQRQVVRGIVKGIEDYVKKGNTVAGTL